MSTNPHVGAAEVSVKSPEWNAVLQKSQWISRELLKNTDIIFFCFHRLGDLWN